MLMDFLNWQGKEGFSFCLMHIFCYSYAPVKPGVRAHIADLAIMMVKRILFSFCAIKYSFMQVEQSAMMIEQLTVLIAGVLLNFSVVSRYCIVPVSLKQ